MRRALYFSGFCFIFSVFLIIFLLVYGKKNFPISADYKNTATPIYTSTITETPTTIFSPTITLTPTFTFSSTITTTKNITFTPTITLSPTQTETPTATVRVSTIGIIGTPGMMSSDSLSFFMPWAVAVNSSGIVYVADTRRNVIREITRSGETKIIAGKLYELTNTAGFTDGPATLALFNSPAGIAVDNLGNVYVGDYGNHLIRKITPNGFVTTIAGSAGVTGSTNGPATTALFNSPYGVAVGSSGNVYVTDINNRLIRKISGGIVSVLSGSGKKGDANGKGIDASFGAPSGVAVDSVGNVYVADTSNNMIRKITRRGVVIAFAGSGKKGSKNGIGMAASFNSPYGIAVDSSGNVYVADTGNNLIREITSWGLVSTLAGSGSIGSKNGTGSTASFNRPRGIAVDSSGTVYVADTWNNLIRKIR